MNGGTNVNTAVEKPKLTRADRLFAGLQRAREQGCVLYMEGTSEAWFCTSGTVDGIVYAVSERGCSCMGFARFGSCKHFALLLDRKGLRPPTVAELEDALNVAADYEERARGGFLKTTADWRSQLTARHRAERLLSLAAAEGMPITTDTSDAADDLPPAA